MAKSQLGGSSNWLAITCLETSDTYIRQLQTVAIEKSKTRGKVSVPPWGTLKPVFTYPSERHRGSYGMKVKALLNLLPIGAIVVVGWFYVSSQWQQSQARRPGDDPTASSPAPGLLPKPQSEPATVINVHDGDTITVKLGWQKVKVRLCGIAAPELSQRFGVQSR